MNLSRRDFMKLFGVGVASLLLTRCRFPIGVTCYTPLPPPTILSPGREQLRTCWLSFDELAQKTLQAADQGNSSDAFGQKLITDHRLSLDQLVAAGELTPAVADLVQEAYAAAVYHIWRSNAPITCYEPMFVDYAPASANVLVQQAQILEELAGQGSINPQTLTTAQAALEHDLAYYALSDEDLQALYERLIQESQTQGQSIPPFDQLNIEFTPDARAAAQFIVDLLMEK
jgi:hypothetical protein